MDQNHNERDTKLNDQTSGISEDVTTNEEQISTKKHGNRDEQNLM